MMTRKMVANGFRAAATAVVSVAVFLSAVSDLQVQADDTTLSDNQVTAEEEEAFEQTNAIRKENGLPTLTFNAALYKDAAVRAQEITKVFSHTRPDGNVWYSLDTANMYGENLAEGYFSATAVMNAWMASPGHRANILSTEYKSCAIFALHLNGNVYWVTEFGI